MNTVSVGTSGSKVAIYELAKELGIAHKDLVEKVRALGIEAKNHMSRLERDEVDRVRRAFDKERHENTVQERLSETVIRRRAKDGSRLHPDTQAVVAAPVAPPPVVEPPRVVVEPPRRVVRVASPAVEAPARPLVEAKPPIVEKPAPMKVEQPVVVAKAKPIEPPAPVTRITFPVSKPCNPSLSRTTGALPSKSSSSISRICDTVVLPLIRSA